MILAADTTLSDVSGGSPRIVIRVSCPVKGITPHRSGNEPVINGVDTVRRRETSSEPYERISRHVRAILTVVLACATVAGGEQRTIPRDDIDEVWASKISLMPEELEKGLSEPEFRDLIGFLLTREPPVRWSQVPDVELNTY